MPDVRAEIRDRQLVITVPLNEPLEPSSTGKTLLVASTRGNKRCGLSIDGKPVYLGLSAYVYAEAKPGSVDLQNRAEQ